jgi:hypothetical protein
VFNPKGAALDTIDPDEVERWLQQWPDDPRRIDQLRLPYDCGQDGPAILVLVPAAHNWQVPVLFSYGDFNGCPYPSVHGAALRHWQQRSMTRVAMEFAVSRTPRTRRDALEFADVNSILWEYAGSRLSWSWRTFVRQPWLLILRVCRPYVQRYCGQVRRRRVHQKQNPASSRAAATKMPVSASCRGQKWLAGW